MRNNTAVAKLDRGNTPTSPTQAAPRLGRGRGERWCGWSPGAHLGLRSIGAVGSSGVEAQGRSSRRRSRLPMRRTDSGEEPSKVNGESERTDQPRATPDHCLVRCDADVVEAAALADEKCCREFAGRREPKKVIVVAGEKCQPLV